MWIHPDFADPTRSPDDLSRAERLEALLSASGLGTWEWSIQTGEVIFNDRWAEMAGYTLAELSPLSLDTWVSLVHPQDLVRTNAALMRHFRGETPSYQCECRLRHKQGHWIWILTRGQVMTRTADGSPALMYGTHQDISQQKRVMENLQHSEHSYELMALGSPSALYDWDIVTDRITWRGKSYEILGTPGNLDLPMRSVNFQDWVHIDDRARWRKSLRRYFKRETNVLHDDLRLVRPDGSVIWVEYHGATLWQQGRALRLFGSFTDVSHHKAAQNLLQRTARGLDDIADIINTDPVAARNIVRMLQEALRQG